MAVTITEMLGTDSIAGSRLTINSNFLLLENAYNDLEDTFNINVLTGSMDVSTATSGQIKAKTLIANTLVMPSSGSPTVQIYGTGASAGYVVASNTIAGATGTFSNILLTNAFSTSGASTFGATATFNSVTVSNGRNILGVTGTFVNSNRKAAVGASTTFPSAPLAGLTGSFDNPYVPTLQENVVYIDSSYVSGSTAGFFMQASTGSGVAVSGIPAGFTLTLIDTATTPGKIATGITGTANYYTGFSQGDGSYSTYITTPGDQYKSSITLMWEPRIDQGATTQKGSWVVLATAGNFTF